MTYLVGNLIDITLAVILDWLIGDPYWFPHPVIYIGKLISIIEKVGRKYIKKQNTLRVYGLFMVIVVCSISFAIPYFVIKWCQAPFMAGCLVPYHIINIIIIWTTIAARCLHKEAVKIYKAVNENDIEEARVKLSYIVGRDTKNLTIREIIRADVETVAENTSDGIIAPLFYAMIFGAPFAMLYKSINTMDSMVGYLNEKYRYLGFFPAKIDDIVNYIPARLTALLICLSAPIVKGSIKDSFCITKRDRKNHKSPNCGYPEAAAAGAMGIQIGGENTYFGEKVYKPTIGDSKVELSKTHILQVIKLMYSSEVLLIALYFGVIVVVLSI